VLTSAFSFVTLAVFPPPGIFLDRGPFFLSPLPWGSVTSFRRRLSCVTVFLFRYPNYPRPFPRFFFSPPPGFPHAVLICFFLSRELPPITVCNPGNWPPTVCPPGFSPDHSLLPLWPTRPCSTPHTRFERLLLSLPFSPLSPGAFFQYETLVGIIFFFFLLPSVVFF